MKCATSVATPDEPAWNEFAIRVECNPRPDVASAFRFVLGTAIFFFRVNETPNFIALNPLGFEIAKRLVLIF